MQSNRRSFREFKNMPYPDGYVTDFFGNKLIYDEKNYDPVLPKKKFQQMLRSLTG